MWSMLKNGVFRRLWCTQTLSSVGDEIRNWAILFWVFAEADQAVFLPDGSFVCPDAPGLYHGSSCRNMG
ncbi:hypothetical protein ACFTAO_09020 [Paenibacillus rhizoplanae]